MAEELRTLEELRRVNADFPSSWPITRWKEQGKKVIGWLCTYVPEEILYAAGALPVRITGWGAEIPLEDADAYISSGTCSYVRTCLEMALDHQFDFLDGIVTASTCDGARCFTDVWERYVPAPVLCEVLIAHKFTERSWRLYQAEMEKLKKALEDFMGIEITPVALEEAIAVYDRTRALLQQLSDLRKREVPALSGTEMLEIVQAGFQMPRPEYNRLLEQLLAEVEQSERAIPTKMRLMLSGSILSNPEFVKTIEELGGVVVAEEICTGVRYWADPVNPQPGEEPLAALARRYLHKFPCARMNPFTERVQRTLALAREYRVDGVISEVIRYCSPYLHDRPILSDRLEAAGLPVLELDVEYGMGGTGQVRTRVQAFLEMLQERKTASA